MGVLIRGVAMTTVTWLRITGTWHHSSGIWRAPLWFKILAPVTVPPLLVKRSLLFQCALSLQSHSKRKIYETGRREAVHSVGTGTKSETSEKLIVEEHFIQCSTITAICWHNRVSKIAWNMKYSMRLTHKAIQHNTIQCTQESYFQRKMSCLKWESNTRNLRL